MKKYFLITLMAAMGFSMMQAQQSSPTKANSNDPIPEGMARITLTTGPSRTIVGTPNLFESEWDLNDERNNMIKGADGIYRLNKAGWFPEGTEIYFKIVTNHSYAYSWPAEERLIYIYETGAFSIDIIFNPNAPDDQKINIDMNKVF